MRSLLEMAKRQSIRLAVAEPQCLYKVLLQHDRDKGTRLYDLWPLLADQIIEPIKGKNAEGVMPFSQICVDRFHISERTLYTWIDTIQTYAILIKPAEACGTIVKSSL